MAEKKNSIRENEKETKKIPRKKASTGAWWKSTTIEDNSQPELSASSQEKKRKKDSGPKNKQSNTSQINSPSSMKGESTVKKAKETAVKKESNLAAPDSLPAVSEKTSQQGLPALDTTANPMEVPASPEVGKNTSAEKVDRPRPKRKRGRPRKKPVVKEAQEATDTNGEEEKEEGENATAIELQTGSEPSAEVVPVEEKKKARPARRKRPPRKKKTPSPVSQPADDKHIEEGQTAVAESPATTIELPEKAKEKKQQTQPVATQDPADAEVDTIEAEGAEVSDQSTEKADISAAKNKREQETKQKKEEAEEKRAAEQPKPVIKLLINAEEPEECRLALLEDGLLESIHVATSTRTQTKNNIYKAKIVAIEPNLQAAFVDYGTEKNGFLPFSEIHPEYYKENVSDKVQKLIDQHQWKKLSITDVVERGRELLVQVVKEEVGKKGANMTTYLSLPGRCVVLMPGSDSKGISRKISGEESRALLREHLLSMNIPEGIGWIVRTASIDITKAALARDVNYLLRLWEEVKKKGQELEGVGLIYQDHDHVLRFLREHFDPDIQEILVDDKDALEQVKGFIELLPAKQRNVNCKLHRGARPIFNQYSIEDQIESIYQPKVNLPSGGSIVIDPTEALVAIDVNSGSTQKGQNFEETIFQANMEAAKELARQLRLRDLGGLIVIDFIDMRSKKNIREVEKQVKSAMRRDKAKVDISRISKFGLMQISRQKLGAPIEAGNYRVCTNCKGRGVVRSVETQALFYLRRIHTAASRKMVVQIECRFPLDVAGYLLNNKRQELRDLETRYNTDVVIIADPSLSPADHEIIYHKAEKIEKGNSTKKQP